MGVEAAGGGGFAEEEEGRRGGEEEGWCGVSGKRRPVKHDIKMGERAMLEAEIAELLIYYFLLGMKWVRLILAQCGPFYGKGAAGNFLV